MYGGLIGPGAVVSPQEHEIGGSQTAPQNHPLRFQAGEVSSIEIFANCFAGLFIGERTALQSAAQGTLTLGVGGAGSVGSRTIPLL